MVSIICTVVFVACLLSLPVISYMGGRQCMPLIFPWLFPAEIIPWGVGFVAAMVLMVALFKSRDRKWPLGALAVIIGATVVFWFCCPATIFLYGMRDRFVAQVGYPMMRQFAREFPQNDELLMEQEQWDDMVRRYPFLNWSTGARARVTPQGAVRVEWGSPLFGHRGFDVAGKGTLRAPDKNKGQVLKVTDDIQFFYLYD